MNADILQYECLKGILRLYSPLVFSLPVNSQRWIFIGLQNSLIIKVIVFDIKVLQNILNSYAVHPHKWFHLDFLIRHVGSTAPVLSRQMGKRLNSERQSHTSMLGPANLGLVKVFLGKTLLSWWSS